MNIKRSITHDDKMEKKAPHPQTFFFVYINRIKVLNTILSAIHRFSLRKIQSRFFFLLEYVLVDNTMELEISFCYILNWEGRRIEENNQSNTEKKLYSIYLNRTELSKLPINI